MAQRQPAQQTKKSGERQRYEGGNKGAVDAGSGTNRGGIEQKV